ncbi:MMPL family transporter [Salipaludibacillus daqingensis]|uniref:MMPL family transporter n=1 Tax=Salipaludibacillus daqingensis TaxID=3041001 RepID=UPI002474B7A5|nr:MMPL family transporter [Salipaludibacillus daqingensis]
MKSLLNRWLIRHPVKSVIYMILLIILLLTGVPFIEMATGNDTLVETDTDVYQDNEMLAEEFGGESVIILFEAENIETLFSVDNLGVLEKLTTFAKEESEVIHSIVSPYTVLDQIFTKRRQEIESGLGEMEDGLEELAEKMEQSNEQSPEHIRQVITEFNQLKSQSGAFHEGIPRDQETLDQILYEDGEIKSTFRDMTIDDQFMTMIITFKGNIDDNDKSDFVASLHDAVDDRNITDMEMIISGKPVLDDDIRDSMQESIQIMLVMSSGFMIIILFVVFPVRWRLLPLVIILIALVGTVGLMGWIGVPITMVSMAVFPILIGLGIDYAIQFQSRYSEDLREEDETNE